MTQTGAQIDIGPVLQRVAQAAQRAGRSPEDVTILGASKTVDPERVLQGIAQGIGHIGENQVQEAEGKFEPSRVLGERRHQAPHRASAEQQGAPGRRAIRRHTVGGQPPARREA